MCKNMKSTKKDIPFLMKFWGSLYNAAPKVYVPGTKFDIGFLILSALFMTCVRFTHRYIFSEIFGFDLTNPKVAAMVIYASSATHSCMLVPSLWYVLRDQPYVPSAPIKNAPQYYKDATTALLQLCSGYMVYDFIYMLKDDGWTLATDNIAFAAHHVVTLAFMSAVRVMGSGHISAMTLMWSGEFTNPIHNAHNISRFAIQLVGEDSFWHVINPYIEYIFALVYTFFRAVVGPLQVVHITYDLMTKEGRKNVPWYVSIFLIPLCSGILIGSIPWTSEAYEMAKDGLNVKYHRDFDHGPAYEL